MSSHQLSVRSTDANRSLHTPVHVSFSSVQDILGVLWESGGIELWDLHTRLESGRGKLMAPILIWSGRVEPSKRQITVTTSSTLSLARVAILGSGLHGRDVVEVMEILSDLTTKHHTIVMPSQGGRLIPSDGFIYWQAINGAIYQGTQPAFPNCSQADFYNFPQWIFTNKPPRRYRPSRTSVFPAI